MWVESPRNIHTQKHCAFQIIQIVQIIQIIQIQIVPRCHTRLWLPKMC